MLRILLVITLSFVFWHCSHSDSSSPATPAAPSLNIDVAAYTGKCLDMQNISAHLNTAGFSYPALRYTRDFHVVSGSPGSDREKTLYSRNLEMKRFTLVNLGEFRDLQQQGCDTVQIPVSGDIVASYKVTDFTPKTLRLEFVPFTAPMIPGRTQGTLFADAMKIFPLPIGYYFELLTDHEIAITTIYKTAGNACDTGESLTVSETQVWRWDDQDSKLPDAIALAPDYYNKLVAMYPDLFPTPPVANPAPRHRDVADPAVTPPAPDPSAPISVDKTLVTQFQSAVPQAETSCVF